MQQSLINRLLIIAIILLFSAMYSFSQDLLKSDIQTIKSERIDKGAVPSQKTRPYIYDRNTPAIKKYNPVNMLLGGTLFIYQNVFSRQFSATCLYNPSCSDFSKQAIAKYGVFKGVFLSADRVMRCNRIAATGIHPIRVENGKVNDPVNFYQLKK